jgi:uncharacterized protein
MEFDWDPDKRRINLIKHGIDFVDACLAWNQPRIDPVDERVLQGEYRPTALGIIGEGEIIVAIVYTVREGKLRLISVRRARRNERQLYQERFGRGQ